MTTNDDVYSFSAFRYDIVQCDYKRLGNPVLHKDVNFDWNADVNNRFSFWNHSRIWCVTKGSGYVKTTFGEWELQEGFAYYIPQSTLLETRCDDYMVQYFIDFLPISDFIPMETLFSFDTVSTEYTLILQLIKKIMQTDNSTIGVAKKTAIMNAIMSCFVKEPRFSIKNNTVMLAAAERINSSYSAQINVTSLAREFGFSTDYFSHEFKKTYGISPQKYVINKRITAAKHLLLTTDDRVSEIAFACGFNDPLYFTRIFSKEIGISPSSFRERSRKQYKKLSVLT